MKASDLRLGNLVYHHYFTGVHGVSEKEHFDVVKVVSIDNEIMCNNKAIIRWFQPIILTDDWLVKFGFEKKGSSYDKALFSISMPSEDPLLWKNGRTYFNSWKILDAPKYVHQLQNLYHAITSEELTIK